MNVYIEQYLLGSHMTTYAEQKVPEVILRQDGRLVVAVCEGAAPPNWKRKQ